MNKKQMELAERRAALVAKAAAQRIEFSKALSSWRNPLSVVDQGRAAVHYLKGNPMALGGVVAFLLVTRPWRMMKWIGPVMLLLRVARMALGGDGKLRGR
jgi:hypothetical protein